MHFFKKPIKIFFFCFAVIFVVIMETMAFLNYPIIGVKFIYKINKNFIVFEIMLYKIELIF